MAKTLQELADTTTGTSGMSDTQGKQWAEGVIRFGEAMRRFDQAVMINDELVNSGDKTLTQLKRTSNLDVDTAPSAGEGGARDSTEMTNFGSVDLTFSASDFKRGLIAISKQLAMTSRANLVREARLDIAHAMADDLDQDIATTLQDTSVTQRVYGGDATNVSELADGDVLTPDLIPDAMALIEDDNFEVDQGRGLLYVAPAQVKQLRKDSQFTNAAEYGSDDVVLRGEIGQYQGVRIIRTTNTPSYSNTDSDTNETSNDTWGTDGHVCPLVGVDRANRRVAGVLAWKEFPHVDYEFKPDEAVHKVFYDQAFKSAVVQENAIALVKVTDQ